MFYYLASNFWEISFTQKFSEKFGTGALGVKFLGNFVHTKFPDKFGTGALGLSCKIFRKFRGPKFPGNLGVKFSANFVHTKFPDKFAKFSGNFGVQNFLEILGVGNIWQLILLFAPTSPRQPVPKFSGNFGTGEVLLSGLPAQIFPEILGQETFGDYSPRFSLQNSAEILGRETLLHEITRDLKFVLLSRVKFLGNFVPTKFSEKFGTGALGVKFLGNFVHTKFPDKFGTGALGLSCKIFRKFRGPKFPGNLGVKFSANFVHTKFPDKFAKFSGNFGVQNFLEILGVGNIWQLILLFAPTSPRQPVPKFSGNFGTGEVLLSGLPAQIFPEILGQETFGDYSLRFSLQNSAEILGRERCFTRLHET